MAAKHSRPSNANLVFSALARSLLLVLFFQLFPQPPLEDCDRQIANPAASKLPRLWIE
jgi:hypothetical protein